ncbi:hypothetical protein M758_3G140200 [Ceratodon purpureus]|uniref:Uncharacterized protein n=1 Tax=Ceratodon purpureus TaxID=3225 RepID=A0A8T0IKP9_CERPU|nr:hypothetical protein KC19_3G138800 [Ceratodon purpureus]KAG0622993.1 hypothetical protein M758_3G140200 [Ceratodon purpureus]
MSSVSSLVTTAASDESSSADSACSSDIQRPNSRGPKLRHRRDQSSTLKLARTKSEIAKRQRVACGCRVCAGKRMVSRSTSYRHLRIEAEIAEDDAKWEARWSFTSPALWLFRPEYC